jgi:hypothetical protein
LPVFSPREGSDPRNFFLVLAFALEFPGLLGDFCKATRQQSILKIAVMCICSSFCVATRLFPPAATIAGGGNRPVASSLQDELYS